jgi:hypothetical protein
MAGYRATITARAWKQHTCVGCGCAYRYVIARTVEGRAATGEAAQAAARASASKTLADAVDPEPCPHCGLVQPDMVAQVLASSHSVLNAIAILALLLALAVWLFWDGYVKWLPWLGAGLGLLQAALHALKVGRSPNADLAANRERARLAVAAGTVAVDRAGNAATPRAMPGAAGLTLAHKGALAALLVGALAVAAPELTRLVARWPVNPNCYPPVAGPGDTVRVKFPQFIIFAINSYWSGSPSVRVANASEVGLEKPLLPARSNDSEWGDSISGKRSAQSNKPTLWIDVDLPTRPDLARRALDLDMRLEVSYPEGMGGSFHNAHGTFSPKARLELASSRAGLIYRALLVGGSLGGALVIVLAGMGLSRLARRLQAQALPAKLFAAN